MTVTPAWTAPQSTGAEPAGLHRRHHDGQSEFRLVGGQHERPQELVPGVQEGEQPDVTTPGQTSGSMILLNNCRLLAPSIRALPRSPAARRRTNCAS